jgi:hypothetical protein
MIRKSRVERGGKNAEFFLYFYSHHKNFFFLSLLQTMQKATYAEVRDRMKTFDLLLFKGSNFVSDIIVKVEGHEDHVDAKWSHSGLCIQGKHLLPFVRDSEIPWLRAEKLYVLESTMSGPLSDGVYDVEGRSHLAVQLRDLDQVVQATLASSSSLAWCALKPSLRKNFFSAEEEKEEKLFRTSVRREYDKYLGLGYDASAVDLAAAADSSVHFGKFLRWLRDSWAFQCCRNIFGYLWGFERVVDGADLPRDNEPSHWMFCSELVCNVYRDIGIVPTTVVPGDVMPQDFIPDVVNGTKTDDADKQVPVLFDTFVQIVNKQ